MGSDTYDISIATSIATTHWTGVSWSWEDLCSKLAPEKVSQTHSDFLSADPSKKTAIKSQRGAVFFGELKGDGRKTARNTKSRTLLSIDIDHVSPTFIGDALTALSGLRFILHTTPSSRPEEEDLSFRLILPLYEPISPRLYKREVQKVQALLPGYKFDSCSGVVSQAMFRPLWFKDSLSPFYHYSDGDCWVAKTPSKDDVIVIDDADIEIVMPGEESAKQSISPEDLPGIQGDFCSLYSVDFVLQNFLNNIYRYESEGVYSYINGTTSAGVKTYDGKWFYSFHDSDPMAHKSLNAYDLYRECKFGSESNSHYKMQVELQNNPEIVKRSRERMFGDPSKTAESSSEVDTEDGEGQPPVTQPTVNQPVNRESSPATTGGEAAFPGFTQRTIYLNILEMYPQFENLSFGKSGQVLATDQNLSYIFFYDRSLGQSLRYDEFNQRRLIYVKRPQDEDPSWQAFTDQDRNDIYIYMRSQYKIGDRKLIDEHIGNAFVQNRYHPVREYLNSLKWDGAKRLKTVLSKYLGARDTLYNQEVLKIGLGGAVRRIMNPGCKHDYVPVLVGEQGVGKSYFLSILAGEWFSDTFSTFHGKEAYEQLQGNWLVEIAELSAMKRAEAETVKHFISKQVDRYRPAYARELAEYSRQCVFFGTTNQTRFLSDSTGNRRFLPITCSRSNAFGEGVSEAWVKHLKANRDQIWAEVIYYLKSIPPTEDLGLKIAGVLAKEQQEKHELEDPRYAEIVNYITTSIPKEWYHKPYVDRVNYFDPTLGLKPIIDPSSKLREWVTVAEVWEEGLQKPWGAISTWDRQFIESILYKLEIVKDIAHKTVPGRGTHKAYVLDTEKLIQLTLNWNRENRQ